MKKNDLYKRTKDIRNTTQNHILLHFKFSIEIYWMLHHNIFNIKFLIRSCSVIWSQLTTHFPTAILQTKNQRFGIILHIRTRIFSKNTFAENFWQRGIFAKRNAAGKQVRRPSFECNHNLLIRCLEFPFYGLSHRKNSSVSKVHKSAHVHPPHAWVSWVFNGGNLQLEMQNFVGKKLAHISVYNVSWKRKNLICIFVLII